MPSRKLDKLLMLADKQVSRSQIEVLQQAQLYDEAVQEGKVISQYINDYDKRLCAEDCVPAVFTHTKTFIGRLSKQRAKVEKKATDCQSKLAELREIHQFDVRKKMALQLLVEGETSARKVRIDRRDQMEQDEIAGRQTSVNIGLLNSADFECV